MKKILMICEAFGGGVFTYVSQLCNDMCDEFEVYLGYSLRPQTPNDYREFIDKRVHLIEIECLGSGSLLDVVNDFKAIRKLREIEEKIKPDIIHLHSSIAGGLGRIAYGRKNNVVVYTPHGYAHILLGKGFKSRIYELVEKSLGKTNSITLTCTKSENKIAKKLCKKTHYIETGVNLEELLPLLEGNKPTKNEKFTVFTVGRVCVQKQPVLFNRIAELVPEAKFVWIGNGELENVLTASNIEVTGWKSHQEAILLARRADVFILCSLGEAVAMSLIENMCMKKLCIVSNTMGNKDVIENGINGYVCTTAEEYASCIKTIMEKPTEELTEKAYQDVIDIYNTKVMKQKYKEFYKNILKGS